MKNYLLFFALFSLIISACSSVKTRTGQAIKPALLNDQTFVLSTLSDNATYGYSENNPVKVGGVDKSEGPKNERRFLNVLAGPNGEEISYVRIGSCCAFKTKNGLMGQGLLDRYKVEWEGQSQPVILYINMYDYDVLKAPVGFTIRSTQ
jgi:hypothetical protein